MNILNDKIFIRKLVVPSNVGVTEKERAQKQNVLLDIEIQCNLQRAGITDEITETIDYDQLKENVTKAVTACKFKLLESLAETAATIILHEPLAVAVKVIARKEKYAVTPLMGVEISRCRNG